MSKQMQWLVQPSQVEATNRAAEDELSAATQKLIAAGVPASKARSEALARNNSLRAKLIACSNPGRPIVYDA